MGIFLPKEVGQRAVKRDVNRRGERHIQPMTDRPPVERGGVLEESRNWVKPAAKHADRRAKSSLETSLAAFSWLQ
jgi:hypothetical protein